MPERDYSATPLSRKLGIRAGSQVALIGAPDGFKALLEPIPPDASVQTDAAGADVVILFASERAQLDPAFGRLAEALSADGAVWVAWPKKSARVPTDLSFAAVQSTGLATGLIDNKSCSIDETWQALRFVVRLADRPARQNRPVSRA
ncbi:MAG: DUF3052 domain-containing protein [Candidatus Limnocylindria bacterium]